MNSEQERIRVWDGFVRVFHWSLAGCVLLNLLVLEEGEGPHLWLGYAAAALVAARVVWGFVGSRYARFADFWPTPQRVLNHLAQLRQRQADPHPGHNPLGALMMLALMALVLMLGVSGYLMGTDAFWGEEWLIELHEALADALGALVVLHVAAALLMSVWERQNLIWSMVTGCKRRQSIKQD